MSDMVERVARAHWESRRTFFSIPRLGIHAITNWDELPEPFKGEEIQHARAAIEAMRTPTPAMTMAGPIEYSTQEVEIALGIDSATKFGCWETMIDEALRVRS